MSEQTDARPQPGSMFGHFARFRVVLVSGPQRSGTKICAKMIAHDTGKRFMREDEFRVSNRRIFNHFLSHYRDVVIQCPVMARWLHEPGIGGRRDVAVVFMIRPTEEIIASQERIGWKWERSELDRYSAPEGPIAEVKLNFWRDYQKQRILNPFEIEYWELELHPLWVPAELRTGWHAQQIDPENKY